MSMPRKGTHTPVEASRCKLCGGVGPFADSHIIPRSFWKPLLSDGPALIVPGDPSGYIAKSRNGIYDKALCCIQCEARFSPYDGYAKRFFLDRDWDIYPHIPAESPKFVLIRQFDYRLLKLFALSIAWRCSATSNPFFSSLALGRHEDTIRERILAEDPGDPQDYAVVITRFRSRQGSELDPRLLAPSPKRMRREGLWWVRIAFGDIRLLIKTDPRPAPSPIPKVMLRPGAPLLVLTREYETSKELRAAVQMVGGRNDP